ncbi:DUF1289 domain-containing protein [Simplicispira hankyongi]|uniref:DUF1289 domain-containing protein n=1 Tax=Simplicispira hankyongi TaxID=2315688 RepID=A0A398C267_9BURK|nr:DUF1289 domain-containing protein [Simplicispira hankyongi]RID97099.1 DUF1289 domain-containing protein [Simplicispira hankyongi]
MNAIQTIAARASALSAAGYFDHDSDEVVPSPCVSVCRMSADGSLCEGCFRSIAEIRAWSMADDATRRAIWVRLLERAGAPVPARLQSAEQP